MDVFASNWNEDDNSNSTAAPDGAPEGMAPSGINNVLRAHQGATKRLTSWLHPKTTGGSGTAFTLSYSAAPGALVDTMSHLVQFHAANGVAPTLNVNALGATPLQYFSAGAWRAVPAALWDADEIFRVTYNSSAGAYRLLDLRNRTGVDRIFRGQLRRRPGRCSATGKPSAAPTMSACLPRSARRTAWATERPHSICPTCGAWCRRHGNMGGSERRLN